MRVFAIAAAFSLMLAPGAFAQTPAPAQGAAPATQKPAAPAAPSTQKPAAPATPSTQKPPAPAQPAAPAPPPPKFQDGMKYAYVNMQRIAAESSEGRAAAEKLKSAQDGRQRDLQDKNKSLQTMQQKLDQGGSVLSEAARAQLQSDIEKTQRDLQRASEDAQQDLQNLAQQVEEEFTRKVIPMIDKVAKEKQVHFVFNAAQSGLVWADPGMDLTTEVIAALNGGKPAAAPPGAAPPAAR
jgi:outer membrane protein